jgi:hypothetical protein
MTPTTRLLAALTAVAAVLAGPAPAPGQTAPPPAGKEDAEKTAEPRKEARTQYPPTRVPDRVILTFAGDPATSQAVTWRTDATVPGGVAELALAAAGPTFEKGWKGYDPAAVTRHPARTEPLTAGGSAAHYHSVHFTGLAPKTKYVYRVGDDKAWSEWFQFETAAAGPEPFGFIYFGDAQNGIRSMWSRVARGAYSDMPKARFIVHAGDLVNTGGNDTEWGEWHAAAGWINGMVPSLPTPGNHEYSGRKGLTAHWRPQFMLPEHGPEGLQETCYFVDYQGVRVVSLNSNERIAEQAAWLRGVLENNPCRWTVLTFHHPVYSPAKGRDNKAVREHWRAVIDAAPRGVDLVLQGHDHTYARSGLMREDNTLTGSQVQTLAGTVYVVSVSGPKMYALGDLPWSVSRAEGIQLYQLIRVAGDRLTYEARTARGDLFDSFTLVKRPGGGNDLIEAAGPDRVEPGRERWNAAAAAVILAGVAVAVAWAVRRR